MTVHANHIDPKPGHLPGCRTSETARSYDDNRLAGNRAGIKGNKVCRPLIGDDRWHMRMQHQHAHKAELAGLRCMNALVVGQRYAFRQPRHRAKMFDARRDDMDPFEFGSHVPQIVRRKVPSQKHIGRTHRTGKIVGIPVDGNVQFSSKIGKASCRIFEPLARNAENALAFVRIWKRPLAPAVVLDVYLDTHFEIRF